jgi:hypothetical protein
MSRSKRIVSAAFIAILFGPLRASAQTSNAASATSAQPSGPAQPETDLATPIGQEVTLGFGTYTYVEPGDTGISIHGPKVAAEYSGTMSLNRSGRWSLQADARGLVGRTTYTGWCSPFVITPDSTSPNGYFLDLGDSSPCNETGDKDWYVEGRGLVAKDFVGENWGWSPEFGLGIRHLSNGISGVSGYRTDNYLYVPVGITARTRVASRRTLSISLEYDQLIHGWQKTRDSQLGGGDVPATPTAPAFTIQGFSDVSFDQHSGWAVRARAKYQISQRWSVEPEYIHWSVSASPVNDETATFTVNNITAQEQLGFYEPVNRTDEFVVKVGFHF